MSFNCILPAIMCMIYRSYMLIQKWKWENDLLYEHFVAIFSVFLVSMSGTSVRIDISMVYRRDKCKVKNRKAEKRIKPRYFWRMNFVCIFYVIYSRNVQVMIQIYHYISNQINDSISFLGFSSVWCK